MIVINEEDYHLAKEKFKCPIYRIHGTGINTEKYSRINDQELDRIRQKYKLQNKVVILCTGELNKNKNQKTVITAMQIVVKSVPNAVFACGTRTGEKQFG